MVPQPLTLLGVTSIMMAAALASVALGSARLKGHKKHIVGGRVKRRNSERRLPPPQLPHQRKGTPPGMLQHLCAPARHARLPPRTTNRPGHPPPHGGQLARAPGRQGAVAVHSLAQAAGRPTIHAARIYDAHATALIHAAEQLHHHAPAPTPL